MDKYFPYSIQISREGWHLIGKLEAAERGGDARPPFIVVARRMAEALERTRRTGEATPTGGEINLFALLNRAYRYVIRHYDREQNRQALQKASRAAGFPVESDAFAAIATGFLQHYPPLPEPADFSTSIEADVCLTELFILRFNGENPALAPFKPLCDDAVLAQAVPSRQLARGLEMHLGGEKPFAPAGLSLPEMLWAPIKASPGSLAGQVEFISNNWKSILPPELSLEFLTALDILAEERRPSFGGAGQPQVLEFFKGGKLGRGDHDYPEYERFSSDADWMANVVMIAKMSYVWLDQLSKAYRRPVNRLDQIPDEELDRLARWGFTCLWLIGVWERSPASQQIKHMGGNTEAIASAYSLYDYVVAADLGGDGALANLKERCEARGIRLASDMVPNHTGIFSKWVTEHPDWFIQLDYPPYPAYSYNGADLSPSPDVTVQIEDGYWDRTDAAVVFKHYDHRNGRSRYIYHGNDGTSTPWNDTAQLNYLLPEVREAVIQTILHVARQFPVIRFDAAMTLAKKHYQRLWYPQPGHGSGVPSRAEHGLSREAFDAAMPEEFWREVVDRVSVEAPGTLLLAEAFWLMEGYFVRTLGMHRVYNSAFMNMLKMEDNAKYRQTVKNVLEFDPEILKRFVNFMNNPDERTAVEQFGKEGKYFGACLLLVTMPGLPMFGHGQVEGFHEKYGMEYRRAAWDEPVDDHLVYLHEKLIFPLVRRRHIFSGSENFIFYDFFAGASVNEDVFAYSNRNGSERGLIVYHNRYATTSGWIRTSTAMARKSTDGSSFLVQTTLGEALQFRGDDRIYYAFRDYGSGLEFIRSGRELCEQGLYLGLEAFQYYAFLDFREIHDDDTGLWGILTGRLNGAGVPSLDQTMKQVRYAGLLGRYQTLCQLLKSRSRAFLDPAATEAYREETLSLMRDEATMLLTLLAAEGLSIDPDYAAGIILRGAEAMGGMLAAPEKDKAQSKPLQELSALLNEPWALSLFIPCLFLQGTVAAGLLQSSGWFADFGLDASTAEYFRREPGAATAPLDADAGADLIGISLRNGEVFLGGKEEVASIGRKLFLQSEIRQFLLVHSSGGKEWFNKERWEILLQWLGLSAVIREAVVSGEQKRMLSVLAECHQVEQALKALADTWGYEVPSLREEKEE